MAKPAIDDVVVQRDTQPRQGGGQGPWASHYRVLTPSMRQLGGTLGMVENTLPPGAVGCPFHWHTHEDEVFYVLSGRGVFRYGDEVREIGPGDCMTCPAGTGVAHQIANPFDEDLIYLALGPRHPHEICGYPDTGKVLVRSLKFVGRLTGADYMDGEPDPPVIFEMWDRSQA